MNECSRQEFEQNLKQLQDDKQSGLTGPFIHSAPKGNMFRGPFREHVWMVGKDTMLKKAWTAASGWTYFCTETGEEP